VKQFLLVICLVGAAAYMFAPPLTAPEEASKPAPAKLHVSGPLSTSWGPTLQSLRQEPEPPSAFSQKTASSRQIAVYGSRSHKAVADPDQEAGSHELTASVDQGSALHTDSSRRERATAGPAAKLQASATHLKPSQSAKPLPPVVAKSKPRKPRPTLGPVRISEGVGVTGASEGPATQGSPRRRGRGLFGFLRARKVERSAWSVGH
jgi:hypothetical protein